MGWGAILAHPMPVQSLKDIFQRKMSKMLILQRSPTLRHTYVPQGNSLRSQGLGAVESQHHVSLYSTFWGIFNPPRVDDIFVSGHTDSCIILQVFDWHQIFSCFILTDLTSELHVETHIKTLISDVMARGLTLPSSSLSSTLVSLHSHKSCICLDLAWMHTISVLDDTPSSLVASWHFSILILTWLDGSHVRVAPCLSCVWGSQPTFS